VSTRAVVEAQAGHLWQWNAIRLVVVPFLIFFIAVIAETNRPPFDLVEADSELVGGFVTDGWWGFGLAAAVVVAAITITRAFAIGSEREETRAIVPQVGVRLWT